MSLQLIESDNRLSNLCRDLEQGAEEHNVLGNASLQFAVEVIADFGNPMSIGVDPKLALPVLAIYQKTPACYRASLGR